LQPNGSFLSTALFGFNSVPLPQFGPAPALADVTFNGVLYRSVNHVVTTNIAGAGIDPPVAAIPEPETYAMIVAGLGLLSVVTRRRAGRRRA